jgi:CheY-like chemotaxis protein
VPRILVVDDEPLISMMVEGWLNELGCEVVGPAGSVQHGLDLIASRELDGAILDINLGGQDCYLVANTLRQRGVPFAFASGGSETGADSAFKDSIFLQKPFDFEGVKGVLGKLLKQRVD